MMKLFKNKKGFAMAELLAVSIVLLFIFSVLFSNYLPLVAEYETRLSYNDVTAQYAAHYIRKLYKEALVDENVKKLFNDVNEGKVGYVRVYEKNLSDNAQPLYQHINGVSGTEWAAAKGKKLAEIKGIIKEYGVEEIIITKYQLSDIKKGNISYKKNDGRLYNYIKYLPEYKNSIYTGKSSDEGEQLYRIILKTQDYGYATTPVLSDYRTPNNCFVGTKDNNTKTITITDYNYDGNECPAVVEVGEQMTIKNAEGKKITGKVVKIGDGAFSHENSKNITNITLAKTITSIGNSAFEGSQLVEMPNLNQVENIGQKAFANTKIKSVDSSGDRKIGDNAFEKNENLATVILPNKDILSAGGVYTKGLFTESGSKTGGIKVNIPSGMNNIGEKMFYLARMSSIELNNVVSVGKQAFSQKKSNNTSTGYAVANLTIPASLTSIGEESFEMLSITNLTFAEGNNDLTISQSAFRKNSIANLTLPARVTSIGKFAFENSEISYLKFNGNKFDSIPEKAFNQNKFSSIVIPNSVTSIGLQAFSGNNDLSEVTLSSSLQTIGEGSFRDTGLSEIKIPGSVSKIMASAFQGAKLKTVTFLDSVTPLAIQNAVFQDNRSLTNFTIPKRVTSIGNNAFSGIGENARIDNYSPNLSITGYDWCKKFASNLECTFTDPDSENKITVTYNDEVNSSKTYTRYVYNRGGATNNE